MHVDARAEEGVAQARVRADPAVGAEHHALADGGVGSDPAAGADLRPGLDQGEGADLRGGIDARALGHRAVGCTPGRTGGTGWNRAATRAQPA